jgi:hypothetical protein
MDANIAWTRTRRRPYRILHERIVEGVKDFGHGGLAKPVAKELDRLAARVLRDGATDAPQPPPTPVPRTGTILAREWHGTTHHVTVTDDGFLWNGKPHRSLSTIGQTLRLRSDARVRAVGRREARSPPLYAN